MLVSVLVSLLALASICSALPPNPSSSDRHDGFSLEAYLQNHLHYDSRPVFNTLTEAPETIDAARAKYGAVYLYQPAVHRGQQFQPSIYRQGGRAEPVSNGQIKRIQEKLLESRNEGRQYGDAARWLKHGRPLRPSVMPASAWDKVWTQAAVFQMPTSKSSAEWLQIRNVLQSQRRIVIQDPAKRQQYAFRLTALGKVELFVKELAHTLHRRSHGSSSEKASGQALEEDQSHGIDLQKRGMPLYGGSSSLHGPEPGTMEFVLNDGRGMSVPANLGPTPGGEAGLSQKWAHFMHFRGFPVFDVRTTSVSDLQQALADYSYIYVYGTKEGESTDSIVQLSRSRRPVDPAPNGRLVLRLVEQSRLYEDRWGREIRSLVDGRPIQRIQGAPRGGTTFFAGPGLSQLDLHAMRDALARAGSINILDGRTRIPLLEMTLNPRGLATLEAEFDPSHFHPRMMKRAHASEGRKDTVEYYQYLFTPKTRLPPTPRHQMEGAYQDVVHYRGIPVFYARDSPEARARQALRDYGSFYIIGEPKVSRDEPVPVYRRFADAAKRPDDWESVLGHMYSAQRLGQRQGQVAKQLAYGAPFPAPSGRSLGRTDVPTWDDVWRRAKSMDTKRADLGAARRQLKADRMLKLDNSKTGSSILYRLDEDGHVLFKEFATASHQIVKRMDSQGPPEYNGRPDLMRPYRWYQTHGFVYDPPSRSLSPEEREALFATDIHYKRIPILFPGQTYTSKAHHAIDEHGSFWMAADSPGRNGLTQVGQVMRDGQFNGDGQASYRLQHAATFGSRFGEKPKLLVYGRPFSPRQRSGLFNRYSEPSWDRVKRTSTVLDLQRDSLADMRRRLDANNYLKVIDRERGAVFGFKLDATGKVLFKDLSAGPRRLKKRMMPRYQPNQVEYYAFNGFSENPSLRRQTPEQRGRYFADVLHYNGEPVFFPASDPSVRARAQQAAHDYSGFWIVGSPNDAPRQTGAYHYRPGGALDQNGDSAVLSRIRAANSFALQHDSVTRQLRFGPGFPQRAGKGIFGGYKTPSWNKVRTRAERVPSDTPISTIWQKLHENGMLVVTDGGKATGYALDKAGNVLHAIL